MPLAWSLSIIAVVVVAVVGRLALRQLPLRAAAPMSVGRVTTLGLGVLGLAAHCTAMFFTDAARSAPGAGGYVDGVNGMGRTSMVLYAVPAVFVITALRLVPRWALATVVGLLAVVGITMYDSGPLTVHLVAILLVVTALAATMAALVGAPHEPRVRV